MKYVKDGRELSVGMKTELRLNMKGRLLPHHCS
jgi:hypothetical protein